MPIIEIMAKASQGFIISFFLAISFSSCANDEKLEPNWQKAKEALGEWVGSVSFYYYTHDTADFSIDFFASEGDYYTTIISAQKDSFGIVEAFVGYVTEHHVYYNLIDTTRFLTGDFQRRYDSLLAINSPWLIVDSVPYWEDDGLRSLWDTKKYYVSTSGRKWEAYSTIALQ